MTNQRRKGDTTISLGGEDYPLRLTLGALASIEEHLGAGSFDALIERLKNPSANDLLFVLHALLQGGGVAVGLAALKNSGIDLGEASRAIASAFSAIGHGGPPEQSTNSEPPKVASP